MIQIGNQLVSQDLREVHFICDLNACKGACCVEGDAGAPLELAETAILDEIYPKVAPYLSARSRKWLEKEGKWIQDGDDYETPLLDGKECAYVVFEDGTAFCGIERAWADGQVQFKKPISCHLYPIRVSKLRALKVDAINYDKWHVCQPACDFGKRMKMPLFRFLKEPLTRKYGEDFYQELCEVFMAMDEAEGKY
jgi:hypothetical protein